MGMAGLLLIKPDGTIPGYEPHHVAGGAENKKAAEGKGEDKGAAEHQH